MRVADLRRMSGMSIYHRINYHGTNYHGTTHHRTNYHRTNYHQTNYQRIVLLLLREEAECGGHDTCVHVWTP